MGFSFSLSQTGSNSQLAGQPPCCQAGFLASFSQPTRCVCVCESWLPRSAVMLQQTFPTAMEMFEKMMVFSTFSTLLTVPKPNLWHPGKDFKSNGSSDPVAFLSTVHCHPLVLRKCGIHLDGGRIGVMFSCILGVKGLGVLELRVRMPHCEASMIAFNDRTVQVTKKNLNEFLGGPAGG